MYFRILISLYCVCVLSLTNEKAVGAVKSEKIKIVFNQNAPEKLYLYSFYGVNTTKIDSSDKEGHNTFKFYGTGFKRGFYRILISDTNYVDVILCPEEKLEMRVQGVNLRSGTNIIKSEENRALWEMKNYRISINKKKKEFIQQLGKEKDFSKSAAIRRSIDSLEKTADRKTVQLLNRYKGSYFFLTNKFILSPLYTDSTQLFAKYKDDTLKFMQENFFNNIDFSQKELVNCTLLPNSYMKYFERHVQYDEAGFKYAVDLILFKARENNEVYKLSLDFLLNLFEKVGPETVFEYIVNKYYDANTCSNEYAVKATKLRSLTVGNSLPGIDISGFSQYDSLKELYSPNRFTLIYFWSSHCDFCREASIQMRDVYDNYHAKGVEIVGFSIDESESDWKKYIEDNSIKWLNLIEKGGWDSNVIRQLMINKTPTYILLDSEGVILGKNHNFVEMKEILNNLVLKN